MTFKEGDWIFDQNSGLYGLVLVSYPDGELKVSWEEGGTSWGYTSSSVTHVKEEDIPPKVFPSEVKPFIYFEALKDFRGFTKGKLYPLYPRRGSGDYLARSGDVEYSNFVFKASTRSTFFRVTSFDEEVEVCPEPIISWGATIEYITYLKDFGEFPYLLWDFVYEVSKDLLRLPFSRERFTLLRPTLSITCPGGISLYQNKKKSDADIRTPYPKPGRAFRFIFPEATDAQIEKLTDAFRHKFPANSYTVKEGKERADFKKAYAGKQASYQNVYTTPSRKSLANSCMRYEFEGQSAHPAEAYASGDFKILWTETEGGLIGSRCVVYMSETPQAGPIYGVDEVSIDLLEEELKKMGSVTFKNSSWEGAKLLLIREEEGVVGPYIDDECKYLEEDGKFLIITSYSRGNYYSGDYSGVLKKEDTCECSECGENMYEEDSYTSESGYCFCESCHSNLFRTCYETGRECLAEEGCEAYVPHWSTRIGYHMQWVCNAALSDSYTEVDGDYWNNNLLYFTEDDELVTLRQIRDGDYFKVSDSDYVYTAEEVAKVWSYGEYKYYSLLWLLDNGYTEKEPGIFEKKEVA